jgi:transposase
LAADKATTARLRTGPFTVLQMAILSAKRCYARIATIATQLVGQKFEVIMVACMRKLLVMLSAMVRNGTNRRTTTA